MPLMNGRFFYARAVWLFLLSISIIAPTWAARPRDRPLLVSARYYTPLSRPWDKSYYHLYRFSPDGSGKTQLTFARHDDKDACWSPDGKQVAFARYYDSPASGSYGADTQICIQAARPGATPRAILRLHTDSTYINSLTWSGDGKCLAVDLYGSIIFVTPQGVTLRQMKTPTGVYSRNFWGFAPDGKHYAIATVEGNHYLVETQSGRKTRLAAADAGVWWDRKTFLSWKETTGERETTSPMTFTDLKGNVIKRVTLRPTALQRKYFHSAQYNDSDVVLIWKAMRAGPKSPLLCIEYGKPSEQLFADTRTGAIRRWQGQDTGIHSMQISPDGRFAYSLRGFKDAAPYGKHRDGRPRFVSVNRVQVTNMARPNRFKDIISGIVDVDSINWRR